MKEKVSELKLLRLYDVYLEYLGTKVEPPFTANSPEEKIALLLFKIQQQRNIFDEYKDLRIGDHIPDYPDFEKVKRLSLLCKGSKKNVNDEISRLKEYVKTRDEADYIFQMCKYFYEKVPTAESYFSEYGISNVSEFINKLSAEEKEITEDLKFQIASQWYGATPKMPEQQYEICLLIYYFYNYNNDVFLNSSADSSTSEIIKHIRIIKLMVEAKQKEYQEWKNKMAYTKCLNVTDSFKQRKFISDMKNTEVVSCTFWGWYYGLYDDAYIYDCFATLHSDKKTSYRQVVATCFNQADDEIQKILQSKYENYCEKNGIELLYAFSKSSRKKKSKKEETQNYRISDYRLPMPDGFDTEKLRLLCKSMGSVVDGDRENFAYLLGGNITHPCPRPIAWNRPAYELKYFIQQLYTNIYDIKWERVRMIFTIGTEHRSIHTFKGGKNDKLLKESVKAEISRIVEEVRTGKKQTDVNTPQ